VAGHKKSLTVKPCKKTEIHAETVYSDKGYNCLSWNKIIKTLLSSVTFLLSKVISIEVEVYEKQKEKVLAVDSYITAIGKVIQIGKDRVMVAESIGFPKETLLENRRNGYLTALTIELIFLGILAGGFFLKKKRKDYERILGIHNRNVEMPPGYECCVCLTNPREVIFEPCRHLCVCLECNHQLSECPVCRTVISNTVEIHFS